MCNTLATTWNTIYMMKVYLCLGFFFCVTFLSQIFVEDQFAMSQVVQDGPEVHWISVDQICTQVILHTHTHTLKRNHVFFLFQSQYHC